MGDEKREEKANEGGFGLIDEALAYGGMLYDTPEDFDKAIDHVATLLDDATVLLERGSFATAAFLAITAIEETGKAHIGAFRRETPGLKPKGRDPFRDHRAKHRMAILPTVFISARIIEALSQGRADALFQEAHEKGFTSLREEALYCARGISGFVNPRMAVPPIRAWEFLLLAIEAADDALVGYTNHSYGVGKQFDAMFGKVKELRPPS